MVRGEPWKNALARLRWSARVTWQAMDWPELLALAAIGFALGLSLAVNLPLFREVRDLQAGAAVAGQTSVDAVPTAPPPGTGSGRGSESFVTAFMAFLPATDMREQQLHTLHGLAAESGVELSRVEYGHGKLEHLPGRRMTMQLTVRGEYAAYRKFLHNLLVAMPNLGIDRITMEQVPGQPAPGSGLLNIRVETSLYYREPAAGTVP